MSAFSPFLNFCSLLHCGECGADGARNGGEEAVEVEGFSGSGWRGVGTRIGGGGGGGGGSGVSEGEDAEFKDVFTCSSYMEKSVEISFPVIKIKQTRL